MGQAAFRMPSVARVDAGRTDETPGLFAGGFHGLLLARTLEHRGGIVQPDHAPALIQQAAGGKVSDEAGRTGDKCSACHGATLAQGGCDCQRPQLV